jgi:hypothetical protein
VTWAFVYLVALLLGLVLAVVTGVLRDLTQLSFHRHLVVPPSDQQFPFFALLGRRLAFGLALFGIAGLVMGDRLVSSSRFTLLVALAAGVVGFAFGLAVLRRPCGEAPEFAKATVVRDITPGGYGQVRLERSGATVVLAAQSVDASVIPAGTEVEVVDCTRSVVTVRKPTNG